MSLHRCLSFPLALVAVLPLALACGDDGPGKLGDGCDPAVEMACAEGLACLAEPDGTHLCVVPPGGECDPADGAEGCFEGGECLQSNDTDEEGNPVHVCGLPEGAPCDMADDLCGPALDCSERTDGTFACHDAFFLRGTVTESGIGTPIEGAHIIALDAEPVAVSDVVMSAADGTYDLHVPTLRDLDGNILAASYTLRASAGGYETFPSGIRTALPIETDTAVMTEEGWVIETALTDIQLIPVADPAAAPFTVSGSVLADDQSAGVLVVAEGAGVSGLSAITDRSGAYTIFNVPGGDYTVRGYLAGLQLTPASISVAADMTDVNLEVSTDALGSVSGMVQMVNVTFTEPVTSVVLVPESTFNETLGRGEVPSGLRAPPRGEPLSVRDTWSIANVPYGRYVALAAFENDRLVRDPDPGIGGTAFVYFDVPGTDGPDVILDQSFKVTEALEVFGPGAEGAEAITAGTAIDLRWSPDSSTDHYEVDVFDATGTIAWSDPAVPATTGTSEIVLSYGGPTDVGMYYQFRVTSIGLSGGPISTTEDLLGVFYVTE